MAVEEKVFYTEKKEVLDNEQLKLIGFEYEGAATLGIEKPGLFLIIKAETTEFEKEKVKEALANTEEIKGEERNKILAKFRELEENKAGGFALFD